MLRFLFGPVVKDRLTEIVLQEALPPFHTICTCRWTTYARDGMPWRIVNEKRARVRRHSIRLVSELLTCAVRGLRTALCDITLDMSPSAQFALDEVVPVLCG